jgi:hypothetical protein
LRSLDEGERPPRTLDRNHRYAFPTVERSCKPFPTVERTDPRRPRPAPTRPDHPPSNTWAIAQPALVVPGRNIRPKTLFDHGCGAGRFD